MKFLTELKRRNVYRAAVAYGVVAWFLTQLTTQVFPFFDIPNSAVRFVVIALALGFPIAMLLSWIYEFTPEGVVRTEDLDPVRARSAQRVTGRILDFIIIGVLLLVIAMLIVGRRPFYGQTGESISQKSVAVLPFENLSEDKANAYFATGIQDEILTRIARIGTLKVISSFSTKHYSPRPPNLAEIARQLGVANILEGSVQKMADQAHINVQLIRAATDEHLWAESYDRKLENIFGVETEVATAVADALNAKLTAAEQQTLEQKLTNNPKAYDAYLRGVAVYSDASTLEDMSIARHAFEEAVRLDPDFATAWAMLAKDHCDSYFWIEHSPAERAAAQSSLERAVQLRPDLPEVQVAQAYYQYEILRDFERARHSFEQLQTKFPNNSDIPAKLAEIAWRRGQWDETHAHLEMAIGLNPRNRGLRQQVAEFVFRTTRDFSGALKCYDQALEIWPDDPLLIAGKASIYQSLGKLDQADELLKRLHPTAKDIQNIEIIYSQAKLRRRYSDATRLLQDFLDRADSLPASLRDDDWRWLGDAQRLAGDAENAKLSYVHARDELERRLKAEPDYDGWIAASLATVYAGLGDRQLATTYIERAITVAPPSKDALFGPAHEETRARIAATFGQKDLAISLLEHLIKIPYIDPITPALLRLDPDFDSLRGDLAFQRLCEEKQP